MRVRGKGAIIRGGGLSSPPAPFIEISEDEGRALIGMGVAEEVLDEDEQPVDLEAVEAARLAAEAEEADRKAAAEQEANVAAAAAAQREAAQVAQEEAAARLAAQGAVQPAANPGEGGTEPSAGGEVTPREAQISEVFEILEADDLVKTGDRAGHPKVSAIEAATGLNDVTAAEVDALWAAREGGDK